MIEAVALLAIAILAVLTIFQLLLILGVPLGHYAWGGSHRVLQSKLRIASAISIVLYVLFALIILEASGVIFVIENNNLTSVGIWILTAYFFIGIIMNAISRSKPERLVMTPVALILAVLCLIVAVG